MSIFGGLPRGDFLIYDCEIVNAIPPKDGAMRLDSIKYCKGWADFSNMGISVLAAYDGLTGHFTVSLGADTDGDGLTRFEAWSDQTTVLGFNSWNFDDRLLCSLGYDVRSNFDLLTEVRLASGQPAEYTRGLTRAGYNLDALAMSVFITGKIGGITGASAPVFWQQGYKSRVINYCLNDVALTARLLGQWIANGSLPDPSPDRVGLNMYLTDTSEDFQRFASTLSVQ